MLITTPESLFLILTSQAREALAGVETVILDEVHAVAGTKRGAHLALSPRAARRAARPAGPAHRAVRHGPAGRRGRPVPAGGRPVEVVRPPSTKEWDLEVVVPIADMSALGEVTRTTCPGRPPGAERRASIWPHVEERIVDLIASHRSTLVFSNSRRLAERLTARLNEIWEERLETMREARGDEPAGAGDPAYRRPHPGAAHGAVRAPRPAHPRCWPAPTTAR